jgi:hypothetical protein
MQMVKADQYRGRRLQLSAFAKAANIKKWAGLWMRVDGNAGRVLGFDNMQNRPIQGNTDWVQHGIVLDVLDEALYIAFGVLLAGHGQIWVDDFEFGLVGPETPVTGQGQRGYSDHPSNLGFEA